VPVDAEWFLVEPAGWVPAPAASVPDVLDKRVVLAEPPGAFRYDMRAVSYPYTHDDGLVYVDVVSEHDWYRSRIREEPVPKSRYPVDRVWVEYRPAAPQPPGSPVSPGSPHAPGSPLSSEPPATLAAEPALAAGGGASGAAGHGAGAPSGGAGSVFDRVVTPDRPPARPPRRAQDVPDLTGRRIVVLQPAGPVFHRRAVSEPYVHDASGDVSVTVCSEHDWYRWAITRETPRAEPCPIYLVWVE
jgi:hypothetical protein